VRYYKFSNNGTIAKSRNYGIKNAKGEYIAFLDSDDTWLEDKLKTQLMYFMKDSDICLVSSSLKIKGPDKRYNNIVTFVDNGERLGHLHDELLDFNFISFSSVMVKASALDKVGYFDEGQNIVPAEDWDLWLRIAQVYKIAFIPKLVGIYRMHSSNSSMDVKKLDKALLVIDKHIGRGWINRTQADRARANLYFHEGWFVIDKDVRLARMLFLKAFNSSKRYKKIGYFSIFGLFLSLFPFLCRFIKKESLDKKIGSRILSLQHL
jgi:glycosyltransferase involved in cell wall biosynthesis